MGKNADEIVDIIQEAADWAHEASLPRQWFIEQAEAAWEAAEAS